MNEHEALAKFGKLSIVGDLPSKKGERMVLCKCDCGAEKAVRRAALIRGLVKSCGCYRRESVAARNKKHGKRGSPEYEIWHGLRQRCLNSKSKDWPRYGGRGISVHPSWDNFEVFLSDVGPRPSPNHSIDRWPNPNGNYEPGNVRWATVSEQGRNRRSNVLVEYRGETKTLIEWSHVLGIRYGTLHMRLRSGWSVERAFSGPSREYQKASVT